MGALRLKWGALGTGWIVAQIAEDLRIEGASLHAVGSRSVSSAEDCAKNHGISRSFGSYEELAQSDVDVVYVATPNPFHFEHAMLAIKAGKHVVVEKPFAMNAEQANRLVAEAKSADVFLMEAMWSRFLPSHRALLSTLEAGAIGEVIAVRAEHSQYLPMAQHRRLWEMELGGGALLDLGVYPLAFIESVLGEPKQIAALGELADTGVDQQVSASFKYSGGAVASMMTTMRVAGPADATIYGTSGRIDVHQPLWGQFDFEVKDPRGETLRTYSEEVKGSGRQIQFFEVESQILQGSREHPWMSIDSTLAVMRTMDRIRADVGVRYPADG